MVFGQEEGETEIIKKDDVKKEEDDGRQDGFDGRLSTKATFNVVSNSNVVGQNDGTSLLLGGNLLGGLDFIEGDHKVSNTLSYNTSWARTPVIDEFVKNNDSIQLENLYNYFLTDWIGPYARLSFETSLFPTERVTADAQNYEITELDGGIDARTTDRLRLADPANPFELFQSAGIFLEPVRKQAIQAELRVGFGARETLASGVLVVQDDPDTAPVEVEELDDAIQAGAEAFLGAKGEFPEQRLSYRLGATALIPFVNNDDTDRSSVELTRLGFNGDITYNALEWLGLSYNVKVLDDPQLLNKTQVQNSLLLTFSYTFLEADDIEKPEPSKEETKPEPTEELEETKKKLEEAEDRAEKAEKRAAELEEQLEDTNQQLEQTEQELEDADNQPEPEPEPEDEPTEDEPTEEESTDEEDAAGEEPAADDAGADEEVTDEEPAAEEDATDADAP
jgi:hypothetical protein